MGSSKAARRERRRAAHDRQFKRLAKSGRIPVHSRAQRLRAEAERRVRRAIIERHLKWFRRFTGFAVTAVAVPAFLFQPPAVTAAGPHFISPVYTAASNLWAGADRSDELPHMPEALATMWPLYSGTEGTASTARVAQGSIVFYGQPGVIVPDYPANWA